MGLICHKSVYNEKGLFPIFTGMFNVHFSVVWGVF